MNKQVYDYMKKTEAKVHLGETTQSIWVTLETTFQISDMA